MRRRWRILVEDHDPRPELRLPLHDSPNRFWRRKSAEWHARKLEAACRRKGMRISCEVYRIT